MDGSMYKFTFDNGQLIYLKPYVNVGPCVRIRTIQSNFSGHDLDDVLSDGQYLNSQNP